MARCCNNKSCACVVQPGIDSRGNLPLEVTGTGSQQDPFLITFVGLVVNDTSSIDLTMAWDNVDGYKLTAALASTSKLDDLGDVVATTPQNGNVLAWDSSTARWKPASPTTAASGAVNHDTSLAGDGSVGNVLGARLSALGHLSTVADGLRLTDSVLNQLVRRFADATARTAASPAPTPGTLSMLGSDIGRLQVFNGAAWLDASLFRATEAFFGPDLLVLSGAAAATDRFYLYTDTVSATTDALGNVELISAADLASVGAAGVKSLTYQPALLSGVDTPHLMVVDLTDDSLVAGVAYAVDGTGPLPARIIKGSLTAILYAG